MYNVVSICSQSTRMPNHNPSLLLVANAESEIGAGAAECLRNQAYTVATADNESHACTLLATREFDLVLLEHEHCGPGNSPLIERLGKSRSSAPLPIVVMTVSDDVSIFAEAFACGASDCVTLPGDLGVLPARISRQIRAASELSALARLSYDRKQQLDICRLELRRMSRLLDDHHKATHQFANNVAHELRTPLTVINGFAAILADGLAGELNGDQIGHLRTIQTRVDDLGAMIGDMLDVSRLDANIQKVRRRACSTHEILDQLRPLIERKASSAIMDLEWIENENLPELFCDPDCVTRAIINMVSSLCKLSRRDGAIRLAVRGDESSNMVDLEISYTGREITRETVLLLASCFEGVGGDVKEKRKGLGYGLNVAKELIQINLGDVSIRSQDDLACVISIALPVLEPVNIFRRFAERTCEFKAAQAYVSLFVVHVGPDTVPADMERVDDLLSNAIHHSDLVFRLSSTRWAICAQAPHRQTQDMIEQILPASLMANASQHDGQRPEFEVQFGGSWQIAHELEDYLAAVRVEWNIARSKQMLSDIESARLEDRQLDSGQPKLGCLNSG